MGDMNNTGRVKGDAGSVLPEGGSIPPCSTKKISAKSIQVKPIQARAANNLIKRLHYSGKVVPNSQLHFGVYLNDKLMGAMQFGPSMSKKLMQPLVTDTKWNGFIELNRMAFADELPRNSESRAISVALRLIRKHYKHIEWVISFADGCQCGDGTIYRASGFVLTGIKKNVGLRIQPGTGEVMHAMQAYHLGVRKQFNDWEVLEGFQLRYMYFMHPGVLERLTVPVMPFSAIAEAGATMYKGKKPSAGSADSGTSGNQPEGGGAIPTSALQDLA